MVTFIHLCLQTLNCANLPSKNHPKVKMDPSKLNECNSSAEKKVEKSDENTGVKAAYVDTTATNEDGTAAIKDANTANVATTTANTELTAANQTADILKMDIDCCEEAFDYLALQDLLSVGQTCKRLNNVVGYILQQVYPGARVIWEDGICFEKIEQNSSTYYSKFINKLDTNCDLNFQYFNDIEIKYGRLKKLNFTITNLSELNIDFKEKIFKNVEYLNLNNCDVDGSFHKTVLCPKICPKIKRIYFLQDQNEFRGITNVIGSSNDWLHQKYPTLEHFEIYTYGERLRPDELPSFLELNPNIRKASISSNLIEMFSHAFLKSSAKLDCLAVRLIYKVNVDLYKQLYDRGFFSELQCYAYSFRLKQIDVEKLAAMNVITKWNIRHYTSPIKLSSLTSIEEFCLDADDTDVKQQIPDLNELPEKFIKLKRIDYCTQHFSDLIPFITRSRSLKQIRIYSFEDFQGDKVIDLRTLNREREKLDDPEIVFVYVPEDVYLATKWTLRDTDLSLIRLKRNLSIEWNHDFL